MRSPTRALIVCISFIFLFSLTSASVAQAQAATALFNAPANAPTIAVAQGLSYAVYVNSGTTPVPVSGVTCTGTAAPFACSGSVTVSTAIGTKTELTAKDVASGAESPKSPPFTQAPLAPTNFRLQ
jgi:hypothetical protein